MKINTNNHSKALYPILLASVLIVSVCSLLYELLLSSVSSYFLGNSILQFSLTIGLFMFFMGVGSYLSRFLHKHLFDTFIIVETLLGFVGGISTVTLYILYAYTSHYSIYNFIFIAALGIFIGIEIPIVTRIINQYSSLKETMAKVLSFDYVGALIASIVFPLVLLPQLGVLKTAFFIAILNLLVALFNAVVFRKILKWANAQISVSTLLIVGFSIAFAFAEKIDFSLEQKVFQDKIILRKHTPYQRLVLTRWNNDYRLFINGSIQFSSSDEYRYHESLVHLPASLVPVRHNVLVLGGGDGLVARQLLQYADIEKITVVDLDPEMTNLAQNNTVFKRLNHNAMNNPKVQIVNADAFNFVKTNNDLFDLIIIDLPDPNDTGLGKLYTREFYSMLQKRMAKHAVMVTQSTSPYFSSKAFWCIHHTLASVFNQPLPYQANVPSFGIWGFIMAGPGIDAFHNNYKRDSLFFVKKIRTTIEKQSFYNQLRFLNAQKIDGLFVFSNDMKSQHADINTLSTQKLVEYYNKSADNWR